MANKPLDPKVKERYAFLVGLDLTGDGVVGAVRIGTVTGELGALCVVLLAAGACWGGAGLVATGR